MEFKKLMLLQLFAEEGGDDPTPNTDPNTDPKTDPKDDPKPDQRIIFPDKQSFMARVKREANKQSANAKADFLKDLGIADEDTLKSIIADYNTQQEKNKTELDKALERIKILQDDNTRYKNQLISNVKDAGIASVATELGVPANKIKRFAKLIDDVPMLENGEVDFEGLKESAKSVLDDFPEFLGVKPNTKSGGSNENPQSGDQSGDGKKLTMEDIKHMSTSEVMAKWDEVQAVLNNQNK